ncbi:M28 family peptidase [Parabacteroides sp. AM08-6]|uniref:M20 family metallopeptidase n=1 Tax=Parabacteroides sp. AM08-6 TaxID=2292053 RepID=UPI000EFDC2C1|nr:M28 family peptidase [Parabacteroides sp. AM08-6]RHJ86464.1 glutamine cyclotransferase [Parabacteroides sp. AM08-6]
MTKLIYLALSIILFSCGAKSSSETKDITVTEVKKTPVNTPVFDADSAYTYVARQVAFGPRVPNTESHKNCGDYLASELTRFGAKVYQQEATLTAYDGTKLEARNIIGSYNPDNKKRILLFAHWDTRPYSDEDPNPDNYKKPIDGADDGASGVGALLEIARQINLKNPGIGIDIIFFDAEDYGVPGFARDKYNDTSESWCLGTQFWAKNPHIPNYRAEFGILLDMVGAKNAVFYKEFTSMRYAARYVDEIWETARNLGYGKYFINANGGGVTDDHEFVIKGLGIPCLDIINYDENGFGDHWHTQNDNMDNISRETLKAVGQTVLEVVYNR